MFQAWRLSIHKFFIVICPNDYFSSFRLEQATTWGWEDISILDKMSTIASTEEKKRGLGRVMKCRINDKNTVQSK